MTHGHEGEEEGRWGPHIRIGTNKKKENKENEKMRHVSNGEKKEMRKVGGSFPT